MFRRNAMSGVGAVGLALLMVATTPVDAGRDEPPRASTSSTGGESATTAPATTPVSTPTTPSTPTTTVLPPLQPDGTAAGGRPPQFVVVSFDGAGSVGLLDHWQAIAEQAHARFSFFLSGVYLLDDAHRSRYVGPQQAPGASSIGFANPPDAMSSEQYMTALVDGLTRARMAGHEVGTHYNGHFCSGVSHPVGSWDAADWTSEIDQFTAFADNIAANNGFTKPIPSPLDPKGVIGGRTPCLEGNMDVLYPVLAAKGFRYDASRTGTRGQWPQKFKGLWSMTLDSIPLNGLDRTNLSMDYNLYYAYARAKPVDPLRAAQISDQAFQSFVDYFEHSYTGNRAPIDLGNHFEHWGHDAYSDALTKFVLTECVRPEVRCVSYRDLVDWLDARTPQQLASFQAGAFAPLAAPAQPPSEPGPATNPATPR